MYLRMLKLWNFRKYGSTTDQLDLESPDLEVPFTQGVNVLIGENDSGKTAIIDAIKLVLDTHSAEWNRLLPEDFHAGSTRLRIECRFEDLTDHEAMHFTEWLGMDGEGDKAAPYLKLILDATKTDTERLHYEIRAGADDEGHRLEPQARYYLRTTYLKPLRDAKSELVPRRNSRLSQILSGLRPFKDKEEHELANVSRCFDCLLKQYFDPKHKSCEQAECPHLGHFYSAQQSPREGNAIRKALQTMLIDFFGHDDYQASFGVMNRELRNILEQFRLSLSDEELGLGSQNLLFIAAELLNLRRAGWTGLRLALIEELEAHLHPQGQMRVIEYLQQEADEPPTPSEARHNHQANAEGSGEASDGTQAEPGASEGTTQTEETDKAPVQVILTTHSPNLGSKVKLKNLIICHGPETFPMGPDYTRLKDPDYAFLERFLDVTKANLFFAKGVILVEGPSEELILPVLAKKAGYNLTKAGVSIVNVASTAFLRYAKIFQRKDVRRIDIPVAVVTDLDVKPEDEETPRPRTHRRICQKEWKHRRLERRFDGQSVKTFVSPHWTLEYCLARSKALAPYLYEATKKAVAEMRKDGKSRAAISETYEEFSSSQSQEQIAFNLYKGLILDKDISKPIVAQHFAAMLQNADVTRADLTDEDSTGYLLAAIEHVTSHNSNH